MVFYNRLSLNSLKSGFTLAEVLITLGIIGIVAAMTLPALIGKYRTKVAVTALKKNYSILSQALNHAVAEYGAPESWGISTYVYQNASGEDVEQDFTNLDIIVKYLNVVLDCGHEAKGCFADEYLQKNGLPERDFEHLPYYRKVILQDGTLLAIQGYGADNPDLSRGEIWIDINGKKSPNKVGEDLFIFLVSNSTLRPYGADDPTAEEACKSSARYHGYGCTNWVIVKENQDYL